MEDRQIPLAGPTAAFVFAVQMLNFPVASGTSGHLLGGVLAAVLVGPWSERCASRSC
jgi:cobalt/nickel transport system permease protein